MCYTESCVVCSECTHTHTHPQGLCSAMRSLIKEYLVVIAQLESQHSLAQLTLQKLWYYVQPCMKTLDILSRVSLAVTRGACRGGKTLTTLHNITSGYIGDQRSQEVCLHITQVSSSRVIACQFNVQSLDL